jgi:NAD(P)-dependent dehydrogenase (short-subunit alcohol dehydrogenase family)
MTATPKKTALITGANGGIGRALVAVFHQGGYTVIATDREPATETCGDHFITADLQEFSANATYAGEVLAEIRKCLNGSGLNALINNAAVQVLGGVDKLSRDDWNDTLGVNLLAPFFLAQGLLPELEREQGCVVNISSIHAHLTKKNFVAYATSKAALSGMTKAMAVDLGPRVRVNAIEPAAIETDMLKSGFAGKNNQYQQLKACHPAGEIGQPEEVARFALVMASGEIPFMRGACVSLDGGIASCLHDPNS